MPELISAFTITADEHGSGQTKGRLFACEPRVDPGFRERLVQHKNYRGRSYEENHLEEWIARQPSSLFGMTSVLLVASQNYVHLRAKIDLLFVDAKCRLFPTELKTKQIAKNGGVVPYDLYERQMKPYVEFLNGLLSLEALEPRYVRFAKIFNGAASTLTEAFVSKFGRPPSESLLHKVCEIYVAEEFDTDSVKYFEEKASQDGRDVRLISYRFFPPGNYIEFWKIYETERQTQ